SGERVRYCLPVHDECAATGDADTWCKCRIAEPTPPGRGPTRANPTSNSRPLERRCEKHDRSSQGDRNHYGQRPQPPFAAIYLTSSKNKTHGECGARTCNDDSGVG